MIPLNMLRNSPRKDPPATTGEAAGDTGVPNCAPPGAKCSVTDPALNGLDVESFPEGQSASLCPILHIQHSPELGTGSTIRYSK